MKVGIIGGSAAGLYSAIFIKKRRPDFSVCIYEKNDRVGRKLASTGNGHCNLLNKRLDSTRYFGNPLVDSLLKKHPYTELEGTLKSLGLSLLYQGDLVYPLNYHAPTYVRFLEEIALSLGVEIRCGARVEGYEHKSGDFVLNVNGEEEHVGRLIVCVGGKSQKNLGSDGLFFDELKRHGYAISPLMPGLCPIKTKEKLKSLSGLRHKAAIRVEANGRAIYGEQGEILFKDDGLSGIAIMNASSYIAHSKERDNIEIHVDLFPQYDSIQLERMMLRVFESSPSFFLDGILERPLKEYVLFSCRLHKKETLEKEDIKAIARALKTMVFHYDSSYPFDASQVTIGGVCLSEIDEVLDSKREKGLFFAGEVLDVDGMCGGYNLSFALLSALEVAAYV